MEADSLGESRIAPGGQEHLAHESQFWMYSAAQEFTSDLEEISGIPTNRPIKTLCLLFILGSLIISVTGRGVIFILQGILNIIFAVEGYQGAANLDQPSVLRFFWFLIANTILSIGIGIVSMISIESYCSTAPQGKYEVCVDYTYLYAVAYLAVHVVQGFMTSVLALIFCKAIDRANLNRREGIFTKWS